MPICIELQGYSFWQRGKIGNSTTFGTSGYGKTIWVTQPHVQFTKK